ncbi:MULTISPECIES: hypothetical protein [Spirulina sp. CCY15215]|uniref:hypothetical protein n=1 Tax=Spirulina sp. CCY15215 TaxID=2767591 RepID=UPI0019518C4C|nr:hypothetical protein [Spirulina major]
MTTNTPDNCQTCPICRVKIAHDDKVYFSSGQPGTRARLYARVCQYAKKAGCINQNKEAIGTLTKSDGFSTGEEIKKMLKAS